MTTQENRRVQRDERRGRVQEQHTLAVNTNWERPIPVLDFERHACEQALATLLALGHEQKRAQTFVDANAAAIKSKARALGEEALAAAKAGQFSIELGRATLSMRAWLLSEYENG